MVHQLAINLILLNSLTQNYFIARNTYSVKFPREEAPPSTITIYPSWMGLGLCSVFLGLQLTMLRKKQHSDIAKPTLYLDCISLSALDTLAVSCFCMHQFSSEFQI